MRPSYPRSSMRCSSRSVMRCSITFLSSSLSFRPFFFASASPGECPKSDLFILVAGLQARQALLHLGVDTHQCSDVFQEFESLTDILASTVCASLLSRPRARQTVPVAAQDGNSLAALAALCMSLHSRSRWRDGMPRTTALGVNVTAFNTSDPLHPSRTEAGISLAANGLPGFAFASCGSWLCQQPGFRHRRPALLFLHSLAPLHL